MSLLLAELYPGLKTTIKGFAQNAGTTDAVLVAVTSPTLMAVVLGIDVYATSSGTGSEFFTIDFRQGGGTVFMGTLFSNQVSPPTGLNFSWRGQISCYINEEIVLHSVSGTWGASFFGFLTPTDNQAL